MATNQPLFDDDELPAWLTSAGITYKGQGGARKTGTMPSVKRDTSTLVPANDDMSWLSGGNAEPATGGTGDLPPWMQQGGAPAEPVTPPAGGTSDLPSWMFQGEPSSVVLSASTDVPPWLQDGGGAT